MHDSFLYCEAGTGNYIISVGNLIVVNLQTSLRESNKNTSCDVTEMSRFS